MMTDKQFELLLEEIGGMEFVEPLKTEVSTPAPQEKKVEVTKPKAKKTKSSIQDDELTMMFKDIQGKFAAKPFKNKDLAEFLEKWNLSGRQTPSRLKKLVEAGLLKDLGGSPKSYQV